VRPVHALSCFFDCPDAGWHGRHVRMLKRRRLLASSLSIVCAAAAPNGFQGFLAELRAEARRAGISPATLDRAFIGVQPNQKVLDRDRHQPEFTMTWAQYRALLITDQRITNGRLAYAQSRVLLERVRARFGVDPGVILGIWGLESSFGAGMGDFHVIEALATLAWEGRRAGFFRGELIAALRILDHGDVAPPQMLGSYAGAMGQPQFMPSSYLRYAVDFEGHGRRDIWTSKPDVLGSIANYLAQSGWRGGESWGQPITLPATFDRVAAGRDERRPVGEWARLGVRSADGKPLPRGDAPAAVLLPDGAAGEAFLVYGNFAAIRRYNPSDYYALVVGLLGDALVA
jgi:peptidoglycan lytic transglycosylase B